MPYDPEQRPEIINLLQGWSSVIVSSSDGINRNIFLHLIHAFENFLLISNRIWPLYKKNKEDYEAKQNATIQHQINRFLKNNTHLSSDEQHIAMLNIIQQVFNKEGDGDCFFRDLQGNLISHRWLIKSYKTASIANDRPLEVYTKKAKDYKKLYIEAGDTFQNDKIVVEHNFHGGQSRENPVNSIASDAIRFLTETCKETEDKHLIILELVISCLGTIFNLPAIHANSLKLLTDDETINTQSFYKEGCDKVAHQSPNNRKGSRKDSLQKQISKKKLAEEIKIDLKSSSDGFKTFFSSSPSPRPSERRNDVTLDPEEIGQKAQLETYLTALVKIAVSLYKLSETIFSNIHLDKNYQTFWKS